MPNVDKKKNKSMKDLEFKKRKEEKLMRRKQSINKK